MTGSDQDFDGLCRQFGLGKAWPASLVSMVADAQQADGLSGSPTHYAGVNAFMVSLPPPVDLSRTQHTAKCIGLGSSEAEVREAYGAANLMADGKDYGSAHPRMRLDARSGLRRGMRAEVRR